MTVDNTTRTRITIPEICERLAIGRPSVYRMLESGVIPAIRIGKRWIVTRYAYERWEKTCGLRPTDAAWNEPAEIRSAS